MKASSAFALIASLGVAGLSGLLANQWIDQRLGASEPPADLEPVVSTITDIPVGATIEAAQLRMLHLPPEAAPPEAIRELDAVIGQVVMQPLYRGEILTERRLSELTGGNRLAAVIEPGLRAVTVRVNDVIGVAGFVTPGSRVDVVATDRQGRANSARTLLQNLRVLAVDQEVNAGKSDPEVVRAVTLEVTPEQAEKLVLATEKGRLQLTLRNPKDLEPWRPAAPLLASSTAAPAVRSRPVRYRVELVRGTAISRTTVAP